MFDNMKDRKGRSQRFACFRLILIVGNQKFDIENERSGISQVSIKSYNFSIRIQTWFVPFIEYFEIAMTQILVKFRMLG